MLNANYQLKFVKYFVNDSSMLFDEKRNEEFAYLLRNDACVNA